MGTAASEASQAGAPGGATGHTSGLPTSEQPTWHCVTPAVGSPTLTESQPGTLPPSGLQFSLSWFFHLAIYNQTAQDGHDSAPRRGHCAAQLAS